MCLRFILFGTLGFLNLGGYFLPHFRKVFNYHLLKYFLMSFLLSSFSGTLMIQMLGHLTFSQRSLRLFSFLLILFSPLLLLFPPFYLPPHLSALLHQLFYCQFLPECFYSVIALFVIDWLFFISSRSLLSISCIFSILVSSLFICNSIMFSRFWIVFTIIILNSFPGRLPIPSFVWFGGSFYHVPLPAKYCSAFSFCLDCCVSSPFCRLEVFGSS